MITFKEHITEHCKKGEYFKAFNYLQVKILKALYENHLKDRVEGFGDFNIASNSELLMMIFENLPSALSLLGDVMCPHYKGRETVLKIAKNVKGLAQNSREADYGLYRMYPEITVPLIDYDEVNEEPRWIHFEKADKLTKAKFKQLTGIGFDDFGNMLEDAESYREGTTDYNMREGITPEEQDRIEDSEIFQQVTDLMGDFDILAGDLTKTSNWGIYKNEPVIIDLGFSSDVHKQYYT